jgi:membrane-associated phospholipid phosphatase
MKKKTFYLITTVLFCGNIQAQEVPVPNAEEFLPGPPEFTSVQYIKDYLQYEWGKTERDTELGQQAKMDSETDLNKDQYAEELTTNYLDAFSKVIGLELSARNTPNIYTLFQYCITYSEKAQAKAQSSYYYRRPYARFNQTTLVPKYEDQYRNISSYPSSQAMMGWLFALMLTEVCPDKQDEVLTRGYAYGTSSVISGYHWDSDSYAGCLLASALVCRLHSHTGFNAMITSAINEYEKKSGVTNKKRSSVDDAYFTIDELPNAYKYLPEPPSISSSIFTTDLSAHIDGIIARTTDDGTIAAQDVDDSAEYYCKIFSEVLGKNFSKTASPQLYKLFKTIYPSAGDATKTCKSYYKRLRPFVQLNESTSTGGTPENDPLRNNGSYPSGHACAGWLFSLVMAEIAPDYEEALLARAFKYGNGRVITGYHWQSDVDMGRLVGAAAYARLHTNHDFLEQLELARKEFQNSSGIRAAKADEGSADIYDLKGVRLNGQPTRSGIYIQGNKKVAY